MNIKRFLSGALCAVLLLALCPAAAADAPCEISSAEELSLLRETPDGDFVLTADIDMTGVDWQPIAFSGTLDGGGHTIYNLTVTSLGADRAETVDGNDKTYDTALTGFFSVLSGASVRDLSLRGVNIAVETPENVFAGTLAGFASPETVLENVSVFDARIDLTETCQREPADEHDRCIAGIGGLVGFGGGTYTNCSADSTLVFSDESIASLRCEEFLGGILSCGNAALTGCTAAIDGYAACRGYAHNGGLVGMFYQYDKTVDIGTISGCAVTGRITFFEDNADRRAYCEAFAGEFLTWTNITECTADFQRNEIFDYSAAVKPEKCAEPSYTDTVVTGRSIGGPVRILKNKMAREYLALEKRGATLEELEQLTLGGLRRAVLEGDVETGSVMSGQVAGMLHEIRPVAEIFRELYESGIARAKATAAEWSDAE